VAGHDPKPDLNEFSDYCEAFTSIARTSLELKEYSRLGFRVLYERQFDNRCAAGESMAECVTLPVLVGRHFNVQGGTLQPEFALRWEGQSVGVLARLAVQTRKIDFDAPLGVGELTPVHLEQNLLALDVDYYTLASIAIGQFKAPDWIQQAYRLIKRDIAQFLRGD
jgi:hypothetical protein